MSATCRTTGFSTVNLSETSSMLKLIISILMMIGGAPGSTSGGIRITSIAIIAITMKSVFENKKDVICFFKKIDENTIKQAITNIFISITIVFMGIILFAKVQQINLVDNIFMCVSSFSATGLSVFNPSVLNIVAKIILMILMFIGRIGPISVVSLFMQDKKENKEIEYVSGKILL
jgi:trk system potassium uptake protein TrkH